MHTAAEYFNSIHEPYASGFFTEPERSKFYRFSNAFSEYLNTMPIPDYTEGNLYPSGKIQHSGTIIPSFSFTYAINYTELEKKCSDEYINLLKSDMDTFKKPDSAHRVGGYAYTHSIPNYQRIGKEGLNSYTERVQKLKDSDFKDGLLLLLEAIKSRHTRILDMLKRKNAPEKLITALTQVPMEPARNLYEAMVCRNFVYYLDFCDDPGRLDIELYDYYNGEDITALFEEFFDNIDANDGWTAALGPDYNELTEQVLKAIKGKRRPLVELRVTKNMPDKLWQLAAEAIKAGGGSPSLYNEELYQKLLKERFPHIPDEDLIRFNGGGCTETMLAGISRVGSLDAGINTALVLRYSITKYLPYSESFEEFYEKLFSELDEAVRDTLEKLAYMYTQRINDIPQPMRTLLIDDCIDNETDFNAGGARWNWSVINFAGIINVIDSLLAIRELIYDKKVYTNKEFVRLLDTEDDEFFRTLKTCECFGVDNEHADSLAKEFSCRLFGLLDNYKPVFGEGFLASSIQFTTYTEAGYLVGPTPDGRHYGEPLCDSLAAIHSNDKNGPTAHLNSVTKLALNKAIGTPVLNLSLSPEHIENALKPLIASYFEKGGMQAQITCVSRADMEDALVHPEKHQNLIVRVGGYSEYFNRLSDEMKKSVIERTVQI